MGSSEAIVHSAFHAARQGTFKLDENTTGKQLLGVAAAAEYESYLFDEGLMDDIAPILSPAEVDDIDWWETSFYLDTPADGEPTFVPAYTQEQIQQLYELAPGERFSFLS